MLPSPAETWTAPLAPTDLMPNRLPFGLRPKDGRDIGWIIVGSMWLYVIVQALDRLTFTILEVGKIFVRGLTR